MSRHLGTSGNRTYNAHLHWSVCHKPIINIYFLAQQFISFPFPFLMKCHFFSYFSYNYSGLTKMDKCYFLVNYFFSHSTEIIFYCDLLDILLVKEHMSRWMKILHHLCVLREYLNTNFLLVPVLPCTKRPIIFF